MAENEVTRYPFNGLAPEQFFILLLKASWALNWQMGNKDNKYMLKVPLSPESDSEILLVGIESSAAVIDRKNSGFRIGNKNGNNNVALLIAKFNELKAVYSPEQLTEEYNAMMERQKAHETDIEERAKNNQLTPLEKISIARGTHYVTYTIMGINVLIYILMVIKSGEFWDFGKAGNLLVDWGGNVRGLVINGQWYRLLASTFLHAGLVHVAFNMYALFYIGMYLEPLLGRWRYLAVYLACGVLASLASTWWRIGDVGIGASGAIFGLYGVFLALLTTNFVEQNVRKPMLRNIGFFVVFNLAYGTLGNIDNVAHVGGLVSGVVFGYLYYYAFISKKDNIAASIAITIAIAVATAYFVLPTIKDDTQKFETAMARFSSLDVKANEPTQTNSPSGAAALKSISLPAWQQCERILDSTNNYVIPDYYKERRVQLNRYVDLQINHAQLLIQRDSTASSQFDGDINKLQMQIKATLDSINSQ